MIPHNLACGRTSLWANGLVGCLRYCDVGAIWSCSGVWNSIQLPTSLHRISIWAPEAH